MKSDNKRILGGDDMRDVTLYNAANESQEGKGRFTDIDLNINMATGQEFNSKKRSCAFHAEDFPTITGANENYENWQAEFLNAKGETVRGVFKNQYVNRTTGSVLTNLSKIKA
jgi:hypothetical protein